SVEDVGSADQVINRYLGGARVDSAERVVARDEYKTWSPRLWVNRVRLLNPAAGSFCVYWKEPIAIALELEAGERVDELSVGAGIKLLDDTWLSCSHQDGAAHSRWTLEPGRYELKLTLENHLKPGLYRLGLGAHTQHYTKPLFQLETLTLEVLDHSRDGAAPQVYDPGIVNGNATWSPPERLAVAS